MTVKTDKVSLGTDRNYGGSAEIWTDDGFTLKMKDTSTGSSGLTLAQLKNSVAPHSISSHSGLGTDFATQYYNKARLDLYLAQAAVGSLVGISGDVGGNTTVGEHVSDSDIHQRVPKFVLRVAKGGQAYQSIGAALAAVPTTGADVPGPYQRYRIEVAPGAYEEAVLLDKPWVDLVGAGAESTVIRYSTATQWPLRVRASNVRVSGIQAQTSNPTSADSYGVVVGDVGAAMALTGVVFDFCEFRSVGNHCALVGAGVAAEFERCSFSAVSGAAVYAAPTSAAFTHCAFYGGDYAVEIAGGETALTACRSDGSLLLTSGGTAVVRGCASTAYLAPAALFDGASGTVYWDGQGYSATINSGGEPAINLIGVAGLAVNGPAYIAGSASVDGSIAVEGGVTAGGFVGDGSNVVSLNASALATGTIPGARFPAVLPPVSGAQLTGLNASALASGTVPDGRLAGIVARTNVAQAWTGAQEFDLVKLLGGIITQYRSLVSSSGNQVATLNLTDYYVRCTATNASFNCQITLPSGAGKGHMVLVANIEIMAKATQVSAPAGESVIGTTGPMVLNTTVGSAWLFIRNHGSSWDWIKMGA